MRKSRANLPSARMRFEPTGFAAMPLCERLVLTGYRYWFAGYETGDISCWEFAWNELATSLGSGRAKPVVSELAYWVRTQRACACRRLAIYPHPCRHIARDEACALSLLGACQKQACRLARAFAYELTASRDLEPVIDASSDLACALSAADLPLTWQCPYRQDPPPADAVRH